MSTGRKVFAVISVQDGKIIVDLGNTANYETVTTKEGIICIVERKSQEYMAISEDMKEVKDGAG